MVLRQRLGTTGRKLLTKNVVDVVVFLLLSFLAFFVPTLSVLFVIVVSVVVFFPRRVAPKTTNVCVSISRAREKVKRVAELTSQS